MVLVMLAFMAVGMIDYPERRPVDPDPYELARVLAAFAQPQLRSFETDREYCGYLMQYRNGELGFTEMIQGGYDGCTPYLPMGDSFPIASMHTHGAYSKDVPAEFPTVLDMDSDRIENVNGYVATPGGRLWYIDSRAGTARQLCGIGCLPQDPDFRPGDDGLIAESYTYEELVKLEARP